jgi:hypothetical protein
MRSHLVLSIILTRHSHEGDEAKQDPYWKAGGVDNRGCITWYIERGFLSKSEEDPN